MPWEMVAMMVGSAILGAASKKKQADAAQAKAEAEAEANRIRLKGAEDALASQAETVAAVDTLNQEFVSTYAATQSSYINQIASTAAQFDESISKSLQIQLLANLRLATLEREIDQTKNDQQRINLVRSAYIKRGAGVALGYNQGVGSSSFVIGGASSIGSQLGENLSYIGELDTLSDKALLASKTSAIFGTRANVKELEKSTAIMNLQNRAQAQLATINNQYNADRYLITATGELEARNIQIESEKKANEVAATGAAEAADNLADAAWLSTGSDILKIGSEIDFGGGDSDFDFEMGDLGPPNAGAQGVPGFGN